MYVLLIVLIIVIFWNWFSFLPISAGDLSFFYKEHIITYFNVPFAWETFRNNGFGGNSILHQGVYFYNVPLGILGHYFDYGVIQRILWFYPILILGPFCSFFLARVLNLFPAKFYPLMILIYLLNTYFFVIMGGGQLTVVFGYLTIPLVFGLFINAIKKTTGKNVLFFSVIASCLFLFDFRYAYIFLIILFGYVVFSCFYNFSLKDSIALMRQCIILFFVSLIITFGMHAFWLLPFLFYLHAPTTEIAQVHISNDALKYFSFAHFENAISFLHPTWPENIFGKVGFLKPEFLFLPILAYVSLFFIKKKDEQTKYILFFVLLGLFGAFLTKGTNEPLGIVYQWLFDYIPGFVMFRDPTKWYTLIALSYSVLIPFSIWKIYDLLNLKFKVQKIIPQLFLILTILYLILLIRPAIFGELGGTFKPIVVPQEYIALKDFLKQESNFSRVLWVPIRHRFAFYSDTHPSVDGRNLFKTHDEDGVIKALQQKTTEEFLKKSGIQYVIVPDDTQKEIFISDRTYDQTQYTKTVNALRKIPYLKEKIQFGNIIVFELTGQKKHFYSTSPTVTIHFRPVNPTEYVVTIKNGKKGDRVIFIENYDMNWQMHDGDNSIKPIIYNELFNSFILEKSGNYTARIYYLPQSKVIIGLIVTVITITMLLAYFILFAGKQRN